MPHGKVNRLGGGLTLELPRGYSCSSYDDRIRAVRPI